MSSINHEQVQVRQLDNRPIYIVDGLFDDALVRMIYEVCRRSSFEYSENANSEDEEISYLNHEFGMDFLNGNQVMKFWKNRIIDRAASLFPDSNYLLHRVHCNNQSFGDFQIPHFDIANGMTALYMANFEWMEEWHGETVFFDQNREPFHIIAPKPGRVLIFSGDILHRGGSPSRMCFRQRLSVAFKFKLDQHSGG